MHIVIGGAFNGKTKWVNQFYDKLAPLSYHQMDKTSGPFIWTQLETETMVITNVEQLVLYWSNQYETEQVREYGRSWIGHALLWEKKKENRSVVIIGTDFSKGIVPMDAQMRKWRDLTGWFFQDLVAQAQRVDQIWYGINTRLK